MTIFTANGSTGTFSIKDDGYHPQAGYAFYYKDSRRGFWFCADIVSFSEGYEVVVSRATTERFSGATLQIDSKELDAVEANIRQHFQSFDLFGRKLMPSIPGPNAVRFTWVGVAQ